jgi:hypothetical protein
MHAFAHGVAVITLTVEAVVLLVALVVIVYATWHNAYKLGQPIILAGTGPGGGCVGWWLNRVVKQLLAAACAPVGPPAAGSTDSPLVASAPTHLATAPADLHVAATVPPAALP